MTGSKPVALTTWRRPNKLLFQLMEERGAIHAPCNKRRPFGWHLLKNFFRTITAVKATKYARSGSTHLWCSVAL